MDKDILKQLISITLGLMIALPGVLYAKDSSSDPSQVYFKNVYVWDGKSNARTNKANVLVEGNLIKKVNAVDADAKLLVIK